INLNGSIDNTFTTGSGVAGSVRDIALRNDGIIIIGGDFSAYNTIARKDIAWLNADGTLNISTGGPGIGTTGHINSISILSDNRILLGGNITSINNTPRNNLGAMLNDGSLDTHFIPGTSANSKITGLDVLPDGKMMIAGTFTYYNDTVSNKIARLLPNGSLDTSFSITGFGPFGSVNVLKTQPDGKVLIGGFFPDFNGLNFPHLVRVNQNGSLDTSFVTGIGPSDQVYSICIQPDGKILVGGKFSSYNGVAAGFLVRLNADGSVDSGFNVGSGANDRIYHICLQPDGKILVSGIFSVFNGVSRNKVVRLSPDGTIDTTFNAVNVMPSITKMAIQPDGKFVVISGYPSGWPNSTGVFRLNADGSKDLTFNGVSGPNDISSVALQSDGKIILGGWSITRLHTSGALDYTFNSGTGPNAVIWDVATLPNDKILMVGEFAIYNGLGRNFISRLNGGNGHSIVLGNLSSSSVCQGGILNVPFTISGAFSQANSFKAQLSDATGSFQNPVTIGTLTGIVSGSITATLPQNNSAGTSYLIRVIATNPYVVNYGAANNITIKQRPSISATSSASIVCSGSSVTLGSSGADWYYWAGGNGLIGQPGITLTATPVTPGLTTYSVIGGVNGCTDTATVSITVSPAIAPFSASAAPDSLAPGDLLTFFIPNADTSLTYTWTGPDLNQTIGDTVTANPLTSGTLTYTVTASRGACSETAAVSVEVDPSFIIQSQGWNWAFGGGGISGIETSGNGTSSQNSSGRMLITGGETGIDIAAHSTGRTITLGTFKGTATFGASTLTASGDEDLAILMSSNLGNISWAKSAGSSGMEKGKAISMDVAGNGYITGSFSGTATFDGFNLTSTGSEDAFIAKYLTNGGVSWARRAGGTGVTAATDIATESLGNSTVIGFFSGTTNFDSHSLTSNGNTDIFVARYNVYGYEIWAKKFGGSGEDSGYSVTTDNAGNIYLTGTLQGSVNFDSFTLTSVANRSKFMAKLDNAGNVLWAKITATATAADDAGKIAANNSQLYTTGTFSGTASFGNTALTSVGGDDIFVAAYFLNGDLIWAKRAGGAGDDIVTGITTDTEGLCYITGSYNAGTGFGAHRLSSLGGEDVFVAKYDMAGNALWARKAGGIGNDAGLGIAVDDQGNSYTTGYFSGRAMFGDNELFSNGTQDMFVAKWLPADVG
ncbi:MAG: hypothetical protein EOP51_19665, partial [Sphingobacteriales bacterium]